MQDQRVDRVAILGYRAGDEPPVVWISDAHRKAARHAKGAQVWLISDLYGTSFGRFHNHA